MFSRKKDEELAPKKSVVKGFKKLILVSSLLICGGVLVLAGFGLVEFTPQLLKYTGAGLLVLAALYHFVY